MRKQVFDGIKVADFGWVIVAPSIARCLADHGAQVIRIESSTRVDFLRTSMPFKDGVPGVDRSPFFCIANSNKYGVTLNFKHPRALDIAKRIIAWADIVIEGYAPGVMNRWGLGYDELKKFKPDIIMLSTSNQGQTGPHSQHPGYGVQLPALAGFNYLTGWADGEPQYLHAAYTDFITPHFGVAVVVAALDYRRRTGNGQYIDLSQYETGIHFLSPLILDYIVNRQVANRMGNRCPYAAPHGAYPCRDRDRWCVIAVFTDEEWQNFCKVIGNPLWTKEPRFATLLSRKENEDELDRLVGEWTKNLAPEEVMVMMQAAGVSAGMVQTCEDIYNDPQLKQRHHFWQLEHPVIGKHNYRSPSFRLSKTPAETRAPAPCLGEHNAFVYTKILGISDEEFVRLLEEGVFT